MLSSSSKPAAPSAINPQLQHESTLNIPPDPGNSFHSSLTSSSVLSSNNHPIANPQNVNQTVTFRQVLLYCWGNNEYQSNHNISSPTPPQIWFAQNVYPLVTPMRMICFCVSQISFFLACGFFIETKLYKTHVGSGGLVAANIGHFFLLFFLLAFKFFTAAYERYLNHYLLKSLGEHIVMTFMSLLILRIGHMHQEGSSKIAGLATCAFLTIDSLCINILLKPGHHYSLLDAIATLTLHLSLGGIYGIPAVVFVFVILVIKNYLWGHIGHAQAPTNGRLQLVWFASDEVVDNLSSV